MMHKDEFEKHTGNLRIKGVCFDTLAQMWEGSLDEYDPKIEQPLAKFYIGKIGAYTSGSYIWNNQLRCASILVSFVNGYDVLVTPEDVELTNEPLTPREYLPEVENSDKDNFSALTADQKDFSDKLFLQMIAATPDLDPERMCEMVDNAISVSIYRTQMHKRLWNQCWFGDLD